MCGLAGVYAPEGIEGGAEHTVKRMIERLKHRGPDGERSEGIPTLGAIGHVRLAINDLSPAGVQPHRSACGRVWAVVNGEIYNADSLRVRLEESGHRFKSHSDTETALHAYEEWGEECVKHLEGMFALAVLDEIQRKLFCVRDRFGMKPLYYSRVGGRVLFASEPAALLASGFVSSEPDQGMIHEYLNGEPRWGHRSYFKAIRALPPAHALSCDPMGVREYAYWDVGTNGHDPKRPERERAGRMRELLGASIERHLRSDVPVGLSISGGIDSTILALEVRKRVSSRLRTFSVVFPDSPDVDESAYSRELAGVLGSDHEEIECRPEAFFQQLRLLVASFGEPYAFYPMHAHWALMSHVRGRVKVLISGQGADELQAGYAFYYQAGLYDALRAGRYADLPRYRLFMSDCLPPSEVRRYFARAWWQAKVKGEYRLVKKQNAKDIMNPEFVQSLGREAPNGNGFRVRSDALRRQLRVDLLDRILPTLLQGEDRSAMAHGIESRFPYLDREFVEFAFGLPAGDRIRAGERKYLLRRAYWDDLPESIRERRDKKGFSTPLGAWLSGPLREDLTRFLAGLTYSRAWIDGDRARRLGEEHISGVADHTWHLWRILSLEMWAQNVAGES